MAPARPFPAPRKNTVNQRGEAGCTTAQNALQRPASGASATNFATTVAAVSPQFAPAEPAGERTAPRQGAPAPAMVAEDASEAVALALVDAMDGSERRLVLDTIAATWPVLVHAAVALLAERRAEADERRKKAATRNRRERRRRRRSAPRRQD